MGTRETTETLEPPGPQTLDPKTLSDPQTLAQSETLAPMSQPQELGLGSGSGSGSEPDRSPAADATASAAISAIAVGDFVWGRIKGHSWPGRVCDPSEASDHASKAPRKDERSVLVAYFGDGSFGWCDPLQLKPFVDGFDEMTRSSSSKSFRAAVNAAVGEIGKCLEAQLCCNCLSEVKRDELAKYSVKGGKISSFSVEEFVGLVGNVALDVSVVNLLEAAMLRSWVVAFERGVDVGHGRKKLAELVDKIDLDVLPIEGKEEGDGVLNGPEVSPGTGNKGRKRRSMAALIAQMDLDSIEVSDDDDEENKDGTNGSAGGEVKEEEVGSGRRERKKSKYLSPPYTFLSGGLAKILVTPKSSEPRTPRSPRGLASGSSSAVVKCSIDGLHKEEESSVLFQVDGVDTGEVLSDFLATAANPLHLKRNRSAKAVRGFFAEFRSSLYSNGAKFDAYQKLFTESAGVEKKIVSNDVGHKSEESKKTEVKRGRKKKDIVNGEGATPVDKSEDGKKSEGKGGRKKKDSVNGEGKTLVGKSEEGKKAGTKRGIKKKDIVNGVGETPVGLSNQTAETAEHSEKKDEAATESTPVTLKSQAAPVSENGTSGRKRGRKKKAEANQSTALKLGCGTVNKVELVRNGVEQAKGEEVANVKALGQSDIVGHSQAKQATLGQESKNGNDGPIINVPVNVGSNVTNGSGEGKPRQKKKSRNSASHEDPAALVLTFSPETTLPSKEDLVSAFSNYGPVIQSETELLKESCSAKVTFRKTSDAEKAFNDKVAALGLPVANYRIRYLTGNSSPSSQTLIPVPKPPLPYIRKSLERMISTLSGSALEKVVGTSEDLKPETRDNLVGEMQGLLMKVDKILTGPAADESGPSCRTKRTHASARRVVEASRRVHVSDLEPEPVVHVLVDTEEHEEVQEVHEEVQEEEDSTDEEDDSEELTELFPGGPEDPRILRSFKTHIAAEIWKKKERGILKCINHASKISTWFFFSQVLNSTTLIFRGYIERSGLSPLIECSYRYVNKLACRLL